MGKIKFGCIYRHPDQNMNAFIQYLGNCLKIVNKENKEIYICGDFNFDLLKIESVSLYQEYYNLLCSFGFLPHIIQPTRIVENQTPSVIDNIFSNNLNDDIIAGNLLIAFSEHHNLYQWRKKVLNINIIISVLEIIQNSLQKALEMM